MTQYDLLQFETFFKHFPHSAFILDHKGIIKNINEAGLSVIGFSNNSRIPMNYFDLIDDEKFEDTKKSFAMALEKYKTTHVETQIKNDNGNFNTMSINFVPFHYEKTTGIIAICEDLTNQKETELRLKQSEQLYQSIFEHNIDAVLTFDLEGHFMYVNEATEKLMGYSEKELLNTPFLPHILPDRQDYTIKEFSKVKQGKAVQYETAMYNKQGDVVELHVTVIPIMVDGKITGVHCIGKDITEKKFFEKKLEAMAFEDYLTKLPNQHYFHEYLNYMVNVSGEKLNPFALFFLDLDRFKAVNDSFGHHFGDKLLRHMSKKIKEILPKGTKLFRYGGDEFIITYKYNDSNKVEKLARDLVDLFKEPIAFNNIEVAISTSIGISLFPDDGVNAEELIRNADNAMYYAKRKGKNQYKLFSTTKYSDSKDLFKIEPLLKNAVKNNELSLEYQPQINLKNYHVRGFEALLRWNNDELGSVSPQKFIPVAEESGQIIDIGNWVIERACEQLVEWKLKGLDSFDVSVNVSIKQIFHEEFFSHLQQTLTKTGVNPNRLVIEITESIASNADIVIPILKQLKALGVKIAIDDFGTGYSSLKYLKDFTLDYLKIDKSFIDDLFKGNKDEKIVSTIITLANNLDLITIAEGVETVDQLDLLKELNCDKAQGYYFSKPLEAKKCAEWYENWEEQFNLIE